MNATLENNFLIMKASRMNILALIKNISNKDLNNIPSNFNNNLIWNLGHILVTQQLLYYRKSNLPCYVNENWIDKYKIGTKPNESIDDDEVKLIKNLFIETIDLTKQDIENFKFKTYESYTTSYQVILNSIEDTVIFNNVHEGLHFGYMMALKRVI